MLESVGDTIELADFISDLPTTANAEYHARIVREKFVLRKIIEAANGVIVSAQENSIEGEEILDKAQQSLLEVSTKYLQNEDRTLNDLVAQAFDSLDAATVSLRDGRFIGLSTGFEDIDLMTNGLQKGELTIIAARPARNA